MNTTERTSPTYQPHFVPEQPQRILTKQEIAENYVSVDQLHTELKELAHNFYRQLCELQPRSINVKTHPNSFN